ncbi:MAG TPA: glycosyltransferase [Acidobacteriota bacterium]|nr:glycosyltransferase [Acidobacteriota bacterium]
MKQSPSIAVIIPCYRSRETLGHTLESLSRQDFHGSFQTIVVESSGDGTGQWIAQTFPWVTLIRSSRRLLPGAARNRGVEETSADLVAFLDADVSARPEWLGTLAARFEDDSLKAVGGTVANANPDSQVSRMLYWIEFSQSAPGQPSGRRWALPSCNLMVRRSAFLQAGGFEDQTAMSEDQILCLNLGEGIGFESTTGVLHRQRENLAEALGHLGRLGYWSGRMRRRLKAPGWRLRYFPPACWLLLPLRLWRIWRRSLRGPRTARLGTGDLPAIVKGLFHWCRGFQKGLKGHTPASG